MCLSVFCWKMAYMAFPTDDKIRSCQIPITSKCECCDMGQLEDLNHLLTSSSIASALWARLAHLLGLPSWSQKEYTADVLRFFWQWTSITSKSFEGFLLFMLPLISCWSIWGHRCKSRYEGKAMQLEKIWQQILHTTRMLYRNMSFVGNGVVNKNLMENLNLYDVKLMNTSTRWIATFWTPPEQHKLKLNVAVVKRCIEGRPRFDAGGIVRNHLGALQWTFTGPMIASSKIEAILSAISVACLKGTTYGQMPNIVEVDYPVIHEWLQGNSEDSPWAGRMQHRQLKGYNMVSTVAFKETNVTTRALASYDVFLNSTYYFQTFSEMPPSIRGPYRNDRDRLPYMRRETRTGVG